MDYSKLPPQCLEVEDKLLDFLEKDEKLSILSIAIDESLFYRESNRERILNLRKISPTYPSEVPGWIRQIYDTAITRISINRFTEWINQLHARK